MQPYEPVVEQLRACGYAGTLQEALHAGRARQDALEALISRLTGGRTTTEVLQLAGSHEAADHPLSADEHWAAGCQQVLSLLGVRASVDSIRGCGTGGGAPLLMQLAELVAAVERSTHSGSSTPSAIPAVDGTTCDTAGTPAACERLLDAACAHSGALFSDALQLFPRDLTAVAEEYRNTVEQLPVIVERMRVQLQVQGSQSVAPAAAPAAADSTPEGADEATLGVQLQRLHGAVQQLTRVFKQELGVWASSREDDCRGENNAACGPARDAATAMAGHEAVSKLVDAMGLLMDMHVTLQDVPADWLAELAAVQSAAASRLGTDLQALGDMA